MGYDGLAQVVVTYGLLAIATVPGAHKGAGAAALSEGKAKLLPQAPGVGHKPGDRSP
jgi:hypothetical protein